MTTALIILIIALFTTIFGIYSYFSNYLNTFCVFNYNLKSFTSKSNNKFQYIKLNKSHLYKLSKIIINKPNSLICLNELNKHKKYLLALSKFIDLKINSNQNTYRAKNNQILIDELAKSLAYKSTTSKTCDIFQNYKSLYMALNIKQKENKIFKLVLAHNMLIILLNKKRDLDKVLKIIKKSKTANSIKLYKNNMHYYSQIYSILKYNNNSNKILAKNSADIQYATKRFFHFLSESTIQINLIIAYLVTMFD